MVTLLCFCCDHRNPAGARFCNACGTPLHLKPCRRCEAINARAAAHCHQCGETFELEFVTLDEVAEPPPAATVGVDESVLAGALRAPRRRAMPRGAYPLLAVLFAAATIAAYLALQSRNAPSSGLSGAVERSDAVALPSASLDRAAALPSASGDPSVAAPAASLSAGTTAADDAAPLESPIAVAFPPAAPQRDLAPTVPREDTSEQALAPRDAAKASGKPIAERGRKPSTASASSRPRSSPVRSASRRTSPAAPAQSEPPVLAFGKPVATLPPRAGAAAVPVPAAAIGSAVARRGRVAPEADPCPEGGVLPPSCDVRRMAKGN